MSYFAYAFAVILLIAGAYHFINPRFYYAIIPSWMPAATVNALGGAAELLVGGLMIYPPTQRLGLWAAAALMLLFLPLHLIDAFRDAPVIGPKWVAIVRLAIQLLLIAWLLREAMAR